MHPHHPEPLRIQILNECGEPVEPPDEVTYSASYEVLDIDPSPFDATDIHTCAICTSPDWRWILHMKPTEPPCAAGMAALSGGV